jgi:hypothetical protein
MGEGYCIIKDVKSRMKVNLDDGYYEEMRD